jgi:hypothetical protein
LMGYKRSSMSSFTGDDEHTIRNTIKLVTIPCKLAYTKNGHIVLCFGGLNRYKFLCLG